MTNYTDHPDSILQPDKPVLASTQLEARDNLKAVAEGDTTAPAVGGTIERLDVIEVTSTVTAITFTADISEMRDVQVVFSGQMSDTATILLQARVAAGTWRTLGTFTKSSGGAGDTVLNSTVRNINRLDGTNKKVATSIFSPLEGRNTSVWMLSDDNAETFSEIRLTATEFRNYGVATLYGVHSLTRDASA